MQKIKLDKQVVVFIGLSFILLVELFAFIPLGVGKIVKTNKEAKKLKKKINFTKSEWPKKDAYLKKKKQAQEKIGSYKEKVIKTGQESRLISYISENSQKYGVKINSITPLDTFPAPNDDFVYVPFRIEAEGDFHNLGNFLSFLEEDKYFFEVKELTIAGYKPNKINMLLCGLRENE